MPLNSVAACSCRLSRLSQGRTKAAEPEEYTLYNYINMRGGGESILGQLCGVKYKYLCFFFYYIALHAL